MAFVVVHFLGLTVQGFVGGVVPLLACVLFFHIVLRDSPNR